MIFLSRLQYIKLQWQNYQKNMLNCVIEIQYSQRETGMI